VTEPATSRLFFALQPDPGVVAELVAVQRSLQPAVQGRWLPAANLHVTLVFLGQVPLARVPELQSLAARVRTPAFSLALNRLEGWQRGRVLCLAPPTMPAGLSALVVGLSAELAQAGFPPEKRPYRAHLTLARDITAGGPFMPLSAPILLKPVSFTLQESLATARGSIYRRLGVWPLMPSDMDTVAAGHGSSRCIPPGGMR